MMALLKLLQVCWCDVIVICHVPVLLCHTVSMLLRFF